MTDKTVIHLVGDRVGRMRKLGARFSDADLATEQALSLEPDDLVLIAHGDLEELIEDRLAEAAYHRTRGQETVPDAITRRLVRGANPITVWREHRGLTLRALADTAGLDPGYLSQLENGKRTGPVATMKKLAAALGIELDDLT